MQKIRTAIVGYGLSGRVFHAPLLMALDAFSVTAVVTSDPLKQVQAARDFPLAKILSNTEDLFKLAQADVDLVVIASPNTAHYPLAKTALELDCHVVVEKPFTVTSEEGFKLAAFAKERQLSLSVYHNRRWDGDFLTAKALIETGKLGKLVHFESHFDRYRPDFKQGSWREAQLPGSGILYDLGSHLIDQALHLFGKPESLYCELLNQKGGAVDDGFWLSLHYSNGPRVILCSSSLVKEPSPRFTLYGTEGAYVKYGLDPQEPLIKTLITSAESDEDYEALRKQLTSAEWGLESAENYGLLNTIDGRVNYPTIKGDYLSFYKAVAGAILKWDKSPVTALEGTAVIEIIEAAMKSHQLKAQVKL